MAEVFTGTSGWHYPHWRGTFYPETLPASGWLSYYVKNFSCVEVNNSFYGLPSPKTVQSWCKGAPVGFQFAVKAWRVITHRKKLKDCKNALDIFLDVTRHFGAKLGPILFQLPPRWRANPSRLEEFLQLLPFPSRCAFEFRDPSWHSDAVYALLARYRAAFCIYELAGFLSPLVTTSKLVYIRLHGPNGAYQGSYDDSRLAYWARQARAWQQEGKDVYLFFDNDQAGYAAKNARRLKELLEAR